MTTLYAYARLESFWSAVADMRYRVLTEYHDAADELSSYCTSNFADLRREGLPEDIQAFYKRLLVEDARFTLAGLNNSRYMFLDYSRLARLESVTMVNIMDAIRLTADRPATDNGVVVSLGAPRYMTNAEGLIDLLAILTPDLEWDTTGATLSIESGWALNVTLNHRFRREILPEGAERFSGHLVGYDWTTQTVGTVYRAGEASSFVRFATGVTEDGEVIGPETLPATSLILVETSWLENLNVEQAVEIARARYRTSVLSRMRSWRNNDEEQRQRESTQREARAASLRRFMEFRQKNGAKVDHNMWIATLPFVESGKGIKSSRRWGIEIETGAGRDLSGVPDEWDSKGDGSLESAYGPNYIEPEECVNAWQHEAMVEATWVDGEGMEHTHEIENPEYLDTYDCYECGEIERDYYDDDDCVELVSPILSSMHSRGLRQICQDLEFAPRTDSAGIHVHVEAKDLTVRQIKELVMGYDHIEWLLEASYDRIERGYCKRRSPDELLEIVRQSDAQTPYDMRKGDRYVTVNLQALYSHGTIEFRAMGPKYNYDHLVRWAMFCREMLNVVAAGAKSADFAKVKGWDDVTTIFAKYGAEYNFATVGHMEEGVEFEDIEVTV